MVTNGFLLDHEAVRSLRRVGLESIQISIDGADAVTHDRMRGVIGCYDRALKAFQAAHESGLKALSVALFICLMVQSNRLSRKGGALCDIS